MKIDYSKVIDRPLKRFTKVQQAFAIFWGWLHEVGFEYAPDAHPSWKGCTKRAFDDIREIKKTMTDDERKEFDNKIKPYRI